MGFIGFYRGLSGSFMEGLFLVFFFFVFFGGGGVFFFLLGGGFSLVFPRENSSFLTFWTDLA